MNKSYLLIFFILFWATYSLLFTVNNWQNHDGLFHIERGYAAMIALLQGQFPLRWSTLLNFGCGLPVFTFYYPLIYYFLGILGIIGINTILSLKIIFVAFLIFGTYSFFNLSFHVLKSIPAALVGSILFAINPYFLSLIYIRANPELLTYCLLPFIILSILKSKYLSLFISLILFYISHNTAIIITFPFILFALAYRLITDKIFDKFLLISFILASTAASFFLFPSYLQQNELKLGSDIAAEYQQHFPTLQQLVNSPWGLGYSTSDHNDGMSFKFGYIQWLILAISIIYGIIRRHSKILLISGLVIISLFMVLPNSNFIWTHISLLHQLQYPWRILGVAVVACSFLGTYLIYLVPPKISFILSFLLIIGTLISNRNHIRAYTQPIIPDFKYIGTTTIANELLPKNAKTTCYPSDTKLTYFPTSYDIPNYIDCSGYVCLPDGQLFNRQLPWKYKSTPIETISNIISIVSILIWSVLLILRKNHV